MSGRDGGRMIEVNVMGRRRSVMTPMHYILYAKEPVNGIRLRSTNNNVAAWFVTR